MSNERVVFRVDASLQIGSGHVMRCVTLADELRSIGYLCEFICRSHPGNLIDYVESRGFRVYSLPIHDVNQETPLDGSELPVHAHWIGTDWNTDAAECSNLLRLQPTDWLIVDHYGLDARWEEEVGKFCNRLFVIDDLADRAHSCAFLLDQNLGRDESDYSDLVPESCIVKTGAQYALLRPEFAKLRGVSLKNREEATLHRVLITMGGVDQPNATGTILEALKLCDLPVESRITVVMGATAPWLKEVQGLAKSVPWPVDVIVNTSNMAALMAESDLAIGAAGSTSWERCCLGLPSIVVCLADNQVKVIGELEKANAAIAIDLQQISDGSGQTLNRYLKKIQERMAFYISAAKAVTDGRGTQRVVEQIRSLS
ncbi:UDP-2,4-diacetamido-2,4,6-trideoxy-beta-L-altropyranose hydrolase [Pseudomonas putida]|uniref:UDP-2,4-diacetamido-2,4, 6-trideoxy-beta-L-altropyranose hydrolase n=1 Tax=Pseudomonas putida TaxID=303 RepID=UPI003CFFDC62